MRYSSYYNEWNPEKAAWLRALIKAKLLPDGDVDERSIAMVSSSDLGGYNRVHFFAGIGGWPYALNLAGWPEDTPVWSGSCPCQPFSVAGKHKGDQDERHVWPEFRRLIAECNPPTVFGEQVASKDGREWLAGVRADLEALGYAVGAADLCAAGVGAPHIRQRIYWVGDANSEGLQGRNERRNGSHKRTSRPSSMAGFWSDFAWLPCTDGKARRIEPGTFPLAHGIPRDLGSRVSGPFRLYVGAARTFRKLAIKGYGETICPPLAAEFIRSFVEARRS